MANTTNEPRNRVNRWTLLNVGLLLVALALALLVGRPLYERYQRERKRAEMAARSASVGPGASVRRRLGLPPPVRGREGVGHPVHDGEVVLLRKGETFGAFIPLAQSCRRDGTVSFQWYYRTDGSGRLDEESRAVITGAGTVSGYHPTVSFGPFSFRWSCSGSGWGWLYYNRGELEPVEPTDLRICMTTARSIDGLDARDGYFLYRASRLDPGIRGNEPCTIPE